MAVIHNTTMSPTKLELLTGWLPTRPWYRGGPSAELTKAGGFRLDDPDGEVGIEFMIVTDASTDAPDTYLLPLTYRGAPLDGMDDALIGTSEHGVLGTRWIYDGAHDPVLVACLAGLLRGETTAQAQSESDTPDPSVRVRVTDLATVAPVVHRVLPPPVPADVPGTVVASWQRPDGTRAEGVVASA
ncbi:1,4-alpha-glucan branching protein [Streptomyces sp. IBSBF 2953]|uniref:maltokinase N-terminal cap-like domain-containing protein n=1 Tax=Streptomyces TaxID=1883 RepID=UPI002119FB0B|nr:1,4-alpha-glucan branching protein [Streptomyces scabiei]MCQ9181644.1 1,4-alpha-glucan branching protein [Streptomyces hayashii]MDX3112251.1 1,4-alpha-glucan branching protein [Streptomyces scabiei]